jgi:hypothetical protein
MGLKLTILIKLGSIKSKPYENQVINSGTLPFRGQRIRPKNLPKQLGIHRQPPGTGLVRRCEIWHIHSLGIVFCAGL